MNAATGSVPPARREPRYRVRLTVHYHAGEDFDESLSRFDLGL